jgi:hypothetical protein
LTAVGGRVPDRDETVFAGLSPQVEAGQPQYPGHRVPEALRRVAVAAGPGLLPHPVEVRAGPAQPLQQGGPLRVGAVPDHRRADLAHHPGRVGGPVRPQFALARAGEVEQHRVPVPGRDRFHAEQRVVTAIERQDVPAWAEDRGRERVYLPEQGVQEHGDAGRGVRLGARGRGTHGELTAAGQAAAAGGPVARGHRVRAEGGGCSRFPRADPHPLAAQERAELRPVRFSAGHGGGVGRH